MVYLSCFKERGEAKKIPDMGYTVFSQGSVLEAWKNEVDLTGPLYTKVFWLRAGLLIHRFRRPSQPGQMVHLPCGQWPFPAESARPWTIPGYSYGIAEASRPPKQFVALRALNFKSRRSGGFLPYKLPKEPIYRDFFA
jgi:hypothetical protein